MVQCPPGAGRERRPTFKNRNNMNELQKAMRAAFNDKLRRLMPTVDKTADRESRLRHYLMDGWPDTKLSEDERLVKASELMTKWKTDGVGDGHWEYALVPDFCQWWAAQVSKARSKNAKAR